MGRITLNAIRVNDSLANIDMLAIKGCGFVSPTFAIGHFGAYPYPDGADTPVSGYLTVESDAAIHQTRTVSGTIRYNTQIVYYPTGDATSFLISSNQKVEIENPVNIHAGGSIGIDYTSMTVSPVSDIAINRNDVLSDITLTLTKQTTQNTNIKAYQSGNLVAEWNTTGNSIVIAKNTLPAGNVNFVIINEVQGVQSASTEATFSLIAILPTIETLEPNGVNQNLNMPITVSWTSENQSLFKLTLDGNTYTGTTAKSLTLQSNTLTTGTKTMTLEVTYIPVWATSAEDHRKTTKIVTFLAYGKPPTPIQDSVTTYPGATPTLTWTSSEQVAYRVKIMQGETLISDSNEVISTALSYLSPTALTNLTTYKSLIQVKNQYGLWSDNSEKTFEISYTEMPQPTISVYGDETNSSIVTNFEIVDAVGFAKNELWRKEQYGEWIRIAYNMSQKDVYVDNYVKANTEYSYKCRAVDIYGGISESEIVTASTQVTNFRFYDLEDLTNFIELVGEPTVTPTRIKNRAIELYAGCPAPSTETDGIVYNIYAMEFEVSNAEYLKFQDITDKAKVILFRDRQGHKSFGHVITDLSPKKTRAIDSYTISFTFMDTAFLERDVYNGAEHAILLYFDGTWLFDGSQYFTGFRSW